MIELPEALARAEELTKAIKGKRVEKVYQPTSPHKFCWFHGEVSFYDQMLKGRIITGAEGFGIFVQLLFDQDMKLCYNDGVNVRIFEPGDKVPEKYQLKIEFTDGCILLFTVAMYGGISCFESVYDNEYYWKSRESISPLSPEFDRTFFGEIAAGVKPNVSAKALLATEQRIPGIGNGVLQDILFKSRIHPKRKVGTFSDEETEDLFVNIKKVLSEMARLGGRDTEKDIWGRPGGYRTILSKNTYKDGCPRCNGDIVKMAYLGGSVYFCPHCQSLN